MTNPLDLSTDNMQRIDRFNLLLPRKVFFKLPLTSSGIKSKLTFNDYLLFFEKNEDVKRRIFEATGVALEGALESYESLDPNECQKKLLKIKDAAYVPAESQ